MGAVVTAPPARRTPERSMRRDAARKLMGTARDASSMDPVTTVLQAGPLTSPPALLVGVAILAVVILVGRVVMAVAWRLVIIALIALTTLWILGVLGFEFGIFGAAAPL